MIEERAQKCTESRESANGGKAMSSRNFSSASSSSTLLLLLGLIFLAQTAQAMPPLQLLRMYSTQTNDGGSEALRDYVASSQQRRPHAALLSRKLRELSNAFLAEEGAKIRQFEQMSAGAPSSMEKRANEFEVEPEEGEHEAFRGRDLLLNPTEQEAQKQKEQVPEMEDEDSAVLAAAAAAGLLRQERNEPNAAVPKMYARHIGDLGGTMFRFG